MLAAAIWACSDWPSFMMVASLSIAVLVCLRASSRTSGGVLERPPGLPLLPGANFAKLRACYFLLFTVE